MNTFSTGERVFLDTSFILNFLFGDKKAVDTLEKLLKANTVFYVNPTVIGELWFQLMANEYAKKHGRYSAYGLRDKVEEVKKALKVLDEFFEVLPGLEVVEITERTVELARDLIDRYNLLPNDAMIMASCIQYGIKKLATFDSDFKRVMEIEIIP
ncbi:type II toxin-antitoxin system VapC family toxin [Thermococcus sp.]